MLPEAIATPGILAALGQKIMILFANALLHPPSFIGAHDYFPPPFSNSHPPPPNAFGSDREASLANLILFLLPLLQADVTFTSVPLIKCLMSPPPPAQQMLLLLAKLLQKR